MHHSNRNTIDIKRRNLGRWIGAGLTCVALLASFGVHAQRPGFATGPITPSSGPVSFDFVGFPNLVWAPRDPNIPSGNTSIVIDVPGIDAPVDVTDYALNGSVVLDRNLINRSDAFVNSGHQARLRLYPMRLAVFGNTFGWTRGFAPVREAFYTGGALRPGQLELAVFQMDVAGDGRCEDLANPSTPSDPNPLCVYNPFTEELQDFLSLSCGMYEVELTVDADDVVDEGRVGEFDNVARQYLFLESDYKFSLRRNQQISVWAQGPTPPLRFASFDITVPGWAPSANLYYIAFSHTVRTPDVTLTPSLNRLPAPFGTNPIFVASGTTLKNAIAMDFEFNGASPNWYDIAQLNTGKVTVVSEDGCVIRQRSASIEVRQ